MDNREIEEIVLGIRLPEILEAIIEVFGEEHREIILDRAKNITFFGRETSSKSTEMYVDLAIKSLTDFCDNCPIDKNRDEQISIAKQRIDDLLKVKQALKDHCDEFSKIKSEEEKLISEKIEECCKCLPNDPSLKYAVYSFFEGPKLKYIWKDDGIEVVLSDNDIEVFSYLLETDKDSLRQNNNFKTIIKYKEIIDEIESRYDKQLVPYNIIYATAMEKIKNTRLASYQDVNEIYDRFLSPLEIMDSAGVTYLLEGEDSLMKVLVGLSIDSDSTDRIIIHEIIHAITSFVKDGKYFSGFCVSGLCCIDDILKRYTKMLEVCVDWLSIKVLLVYLRDNCPMVNPVINQTLYSRCFVDCAYFLENFERQIIKSLMYGDLSLMNELLGKNTIEKINAIMGKIMCQEDLSSDERELLDSFASPVPNIK